MTVALGLVCTDGVLVASDSMASSGAVAMPARKVNALDDVPVVWTASGAVYVIEELKGPVNELSTEFKSVVIAGDHVAIRERLKPGITKTVKQCYESALPHGLQQVVPGTAQHPFFTCALILGYHETKPWLLEFDGLGQYNWHQDSRFYAVGSGGNFATVCQGLMRHLVDDELDLHLGKQIAYRAIATTCDVSSGSVSMPVQMAVADAGGAAVLSDEEVYEVGVSVERWQELEKDVLRQLRTGEDPSGPPDAVPTIGS